MLDDTLISIKQIGSPSVIAWRASEDNFCVFTLFSSIADKANYHSPNATKISLLTSSTTDESSVDRK